MFCLFYLNFGMGFDILLDMLRRKYISEQLPKEFCYVLKGLASLRDSLVVKFRSFGVDCSRFFCSDVICIHEG